LISRIELGRYFDSVIEEVTSTREQNLEPAEYWLAKLEMKLFELKRLSILSAISIHPCPGVARPEGSVSNNGDASCEAVFERLLRTLSAYSPMNVDARRAATIITDLVRSIKNFDGPDAVCEQASIRYCKIFGIDLCDPDAIYLEIVIRESLGLFGDIPPNLAEQAETIRMATETLHSLQETLKPRFGVVKKRVHAA